MPPRCTIALGPDVSLRPSQEAFPSRTREELSSERSEDKQSSEPHVRAVVQHKYQDRRWPFPRVWTRQGKMWAPHTPEIPNRPMSFMSIIMPLSFSSLPASGRSQVLEAAALSFWSLEAPKRNEARQGREGGTQNGSASKRAADFRQKEGEVV